MAGYREPDPVLTREEWSAKNPDGGVIDWLDYLEDLIEENHDEGAAQAYVKTCEEEGIDIPEELVPCPGCKRILFAGCNQCAKMD